MSEGIIVAAIGSIGGIASAGIAAWFARDMRAVKTALTKNGGTSDPPTIPDRFHELSETQHELKRQQGLTHQLLEEHLRQSDAESGRRDQEERDLWAAINELRRRP